MKSKLTAPEKSKVELTESEKKDRDGLLGLVFVAACFIVARGIQHLIHVPLVFCGILTTLIVLSAAAYLDKKNPLPNKHAWKLMVFFISAPVILMMSIIK